MNGKSARFISFLDLMCCGFSGAVLLFLIVASARPQVGEAGQLILIRCQHLSGPRAEVGIEFRPPGESRWYVSTEPPEGADVVQFAAVSDPQSGAESFMLLSRPAAGRWEFRTFPVDFPHLAAPSQNAAGADIPTDALRVQLKAYGARVRRQKPEDPTATLDGISPHGPGLTLEISE